MKQRFAVFLACLLLTLPLAANAADTGEKVVTAVNKQSATIKEAGLKVWELSELSLLEVKSSTYLKDVLKRNGFKITSEVTANAPTAFVAESGSGKPVLGIMLGNEPRLGGFTDVGEVSYLVPTMGIAMPTVPLGVPLHTWMATASNGTSIGIKGAVAAAKVLALTGMDILTDAELRKQMKADFDKRTEGFVYKAPISDIIKEPIGLPNEMRHFGTLLELKESYIKGTGDDQLKADSDK